MSSLLVVAPLAEPPRDAQQHHPDAERRGGRLGDDKQDEADADEDGRFQFVEMVAQSHTPDSNRGAKTVLEMISTTKYMNTYEQVAAPPSVEKMLE
jgi:hypothetical protein